MQAEHTTISVGSPYRGMDGDVDALMQAAEDYKQAKYHISQFVNRVVSSDIDMDAFRDEFVKDGPADEALMRLVEETRADRDGAD